MSYSMGWGGLEAGLWCGGGGVFRGGAVAPLLILLVGGPQVQAGALTSPGCLEGGEPAVVRGVGADLALWLADGREVRLPGIEAVRADDAIAEKARTTLAQWLTGRSVSIRALAAQPDRWGRTAALVFAAPPGADDPAAARLSVAEALLDAGLARARPEATVAACWTIDRTIEARARDARLGLWNEPRYAVLAADDIATLSDRTGTMTIVEGRISRVFEGRSRTYLRFGDGSRSGFAVTIERRLGDRFRKAGTDPARWAGRHVRVRGDLDDRFGLQIDLTSIDQLEFIPE